MKNEGGIMNIIPYCLSVADAHENHPYTCINCVKQLREEEGEGCVWMV